METLYVRTGKQVYKRMTKFWGKLFLINFAVGVVTGIVMEFQFGMNWSEYSRFVGDIFGVPLAIEALLAFFLESVFLGIWIFGWDKLPKGVHAATIWLVAIGSNLSALWILIANSWMQHPVGYAVRNGRAEMVDFGALVTNPNVWHQFPHVLFAGVSTAGFFVLGISAYHLYKKSEDRDAYRRSFQMAAIYALVGAILVGLVGHSQMQHVGRVQPMKMAAGEAIWESEQPAALSLLTIGDLSGTREVWSIRIPYLMSLLVCNNLDCGITGMNELQAQAEQEFGPGNYIPPIPITYWSFRIMFNAGLLMILLALVGLYLYMRDLLKRHTWFLKVLPWAIVLPYLANTAGWIMAEVGRQPWIVYEMMLTQHGLSQVVSSGMVALSLLVFVLIYAALMTADVYLLAKFARRGTAGKEEEAPALVEAHQVGGGA